MAWWQWILIVVPIVVTIFGYSLIWVAGKADRQLERMRESND